LNTLESVKNEDDAVKWINRRLEFLPGSSRPEVWVLEQVRDEVTERLAEDFGVSVDELKSYIGAGLSARDHAELHIVSTKLNLPIPTVKTRLIRSALRRSSDDADKIAAFIRGFLS